jgi:loader and inhibitor of G40P protein
MKTLAILQSCYPNQYKNIDETILSMTAQTWANAFADIPFNVVFNAVQQHILKSQFSPTVAEIRLRCVEMIKPNKPKTAQEAWESVVLAIKKFGYYQQDKAFETLEDRTKRAVRVIGWQNICQSESVGIERANFIKFYDSYNVDAQDNYIFPKALTDKIQQIMAEQKMELLDDKDA